jgi:hypothetical protein
MKIPESRPISPEAKIYGSPKSPDHRAHTLIILAGARFSDPDRSFKFICSCFPYSRRKARYEERRNTTRTTIHGPGGPDLSGIPDGATDLEQDQTPMLIRLEGEVKAEFREPMQARLLEKIEEARLSLRGNVPQCCEGSMRNRGRQEKTLKCLAGEILLSSTFYLCETCEDRHDPLREMLGVEAGAINGSLARLFALLGTIVPFETAARLAGQFFGVKVDAMAVWRCTQRLGEAYEQHLEAQMRADLDPSTAPEKPEAAPDVIEIGLDGCMLGMQVRENRRRRAAPDQELRTLPESEEGSFREVKTAVIFQPSQRVRSSPSRRTLQRRVLVTCLGSADLIYDRLWSKLQELKWLGKSTCVVIVADGAEWIWNRTSIFSQRCEILDFWHAIEHAWTFARTRYGVDSRHAARWISRITKALREGKIKVVLKFLGRIKIKSAEDQEQLDALIRYYTTHQERMRYDEYLRLGYSIGSGAVESAHKQLVHARMRQSGMRWSEPGARRLLALRMLLLNGDWALLDRLRQVPIPA